MLSLAQMFGIIWPGRKAVKQVCLLLCLLLCRVCFSFLCLYLYNTINSLDQAVHIQEYIQDAIGVSCIGRQGSKQLCYQLLPSWCILCWFYLKLKLKWRLTRTADSPYIYIYIHIIMKPQISEQNEMITFAGLWGKQIWLVFKVLVYFVFIWALTKKKRKR